MASHLEFGVHKPLGPLGRVTGAWTTAREDLLRLPTCTMRGSHVGNAEQRACGGVGKEDGYTLENLVLT